LLEGSEARFRSVAQTANDAVITSDATGNIIFWNKAAETIFGYSADEVKNKTFNLIIPKGLQKTHRQEWKQLISTRKSRLIGKTTELIGLKKDGTEFPLEISLAIWELVDEVFFTGIVRDITERKQAQAEIISEKIFSDSVINSLPGIFYLIDGEGKLLRWNKNLEKITGYSQKEISKMIAFDFVAEEDKEFAANKIETGLAKGKVYTEIEIITKKGERIPFYFTGFRLKMAEKVYLVGTGIDISERKLAEKEIKDLNINLERRVQEELEKSRQKDLMIMHQSRLAAMGEMIGHIAHQWRQPLNILNFILYNIQDFYHDNKLDKASLDDFIKQGSQLIMKMSGTIDDFRNFFKPDKEKEIFSISKIIKESLNLVSSALAHSQVAVTLNEGKEVISDGFPNEYSQVILNILNNAKDAIIAKGIKGEITIDIFRENDSAVVKIQDNGGGIPKDILPRIFEPYFTTKETKGGAGIGLYLSKVIIEDHMDGSLEVQNNTNGAEFKITTPIYALHKPKGKSNGRRTTKKAKPGAA
jgi:PAS domain S-box-containing protein